MRRGARRRRGGRGGGARPPQRLLAPSGARRLPRAVRPTSRPAPDSCAGAGAGRGHVRPRAGAGADALGGGARAARAARLRHAGHGAGRDREEPPPSRDGAAARTACAGGPDAVGARRAAAPGPGVRSAGFRDSRAGAGRGTEMGVAAARPRRLAVGPLAGRRPPGLRSRRIHRDDAGLARTAGGAARCSAAGPGHRGHRRPRSAARDRSLPHGLSRVLRRARFPGPAGAARGSQWADQDDGRSRRSARASCGPAAVDLRDGPTRSGADGTRPVCRADAMHARLQGCRRQVARLAASVAGRPLPNR